MKIRNVLFILLYAVSLNAQTISFTASNVAGESLVHPTVIQFGPDGRLYVAQQDGKIFAYTVVRNSANNYQITATETITLIQQIPNHNDNGALNTSVNTRQVTGFIVTGTAASPVIYVSSSDPRIGGGSAGPANDKNLDTNSGVLSKLTKNGSSWTRTDLVRGLPRSEENHSTNGMQLDEVNNILYLNQGGNTNMGAPSNNFVYLPEYAYSASILKINLNAIGNTTYDLPTLDDEDKPNTSSTPGYTDNTDPFGGNSGKNQARLDPNGPVQIYSTGWRNHYDLLITKAGRMYSFDNGPNYGWGGMPVNCLNANSDPGSIYCDVLHYISGQGYYAGHPNPTRGNRSNTFNTTNPQSPIPAGMENPAECNYIPAGSEAGAISTICSSTNGMCEYTASNFSNAMKGDLMAAAFNGKIYRFKLNAAGNALALGGQTVFASGFGSTPLDITAQGDNDIFPGTVWAITYNSGDITVFEPSDYSEPNPALTAYNNANKVRGGKLFRRFWAEETGFVSPVDPTVDMNNIINYPQFYRCVSCHAYDFKGRYGSFIDSAATVSRPKVSFINLHDSIPHMSITELFDEVKHVGGALVDPARTADGTNAALGGNRMPDFSKLLTDAQIWDIVKYLKEAYDVDDLYDITTTGTYPTGTKSFSNIGKDGNASLGQLFYNNACRNCHGQYGREGTLPRGMSLGEFVRKEPSEVQFRAVFGTNGVGTATLDDIKNFLKALSDKTKFPDMHPVWYRDNDNDGYGSPNDTSMALFMPSGYVADNSDCDDTRASVNPGVPEIRDNQDNDCDGLIDEGIWSICINAGGTQYVSLAGDTFRADNYYTTPSNTYTTNSTANILGTSDDVLYKTERYGNFSYNIPVSSIGLYEVKLHFSEVWSGGQSVGARKFNVDVEGARFLTNYDIYAKVGGFAAVIETYNAVVDDGVLNIVFTSVVNNAKVSAISIVRLSDWVTVFNSSDALNGGRLYDRFWADETDFVSPVDAAINMNNITNYAEFYRCQSCHGPDRKGKTGAYIDRVPLVSRPSVANGIVSFVQNNSIADVFLAIKNTGGAAVNPARTADGTSASLGGNLHPDYGKILTDEQIWDIVKFLKQKAFDTEQLYDLNIMGVYPTGTKTFTNLGKDGDAVAGALFYSNNCASCHGSNGRDGAYFGGLSIGEHARQEPYELQHIAVYGNLGTSMYGVSDANIQDIKNLLKALSDPIAYPDPVTVPACTHLEVVSFTLVKSGTAGEIGPLSSGAVINLATIGSFSIRANVCDLPVGSVKFVLNGTTVKTENIAPYAIKGDTPTGSYVAWNPAVGTYTLTAIPYPNANGSGTPGIAEMVSFTVVNQTVTTDCNGVVNGTAFMDDCGVCAGGNTGKIPNANKDCNGVCFGNAVVDACGVCGGNGSSCTCNPLDIPSLTLVRAGTAGDIGLLTNGQVINKSLTGPFNIRADVCPGSAVKSVQFKLNGTIFRTENAAPYALNGDKTGSYNAWNANVGTYTLTVTGFSGISASGTAGRPLTVTFEVVAYSYKMDDLHLTESPSPDLNVFPNPSTGNFTVEMNVQNTSNVAIEIFTHLGQSIYRYEELNYLGELNHTINLSHQPSGIYLLRVQIGDEGHLRRVALSMD